jgi:hypothetical protein
MASIVFRVGTCDEPSTHRGITHLVEHLALFPIGRRDHAYNGLVDVGCCDLYAYGTQDELERFLVDVTRSLQALPLDRLEAEKRVLRQEAASPSGSVAGALLAARYGSRGFGACDVKELGLSWLEADAVETWRAARFNAANAAVWFHGPRLPAVALDLPPGERHALPPAEPLQGLEFPAYLAADTDGVAISVITKRTWASTAAFHMVCDRLDEHLRRDEGLAYEVWLDHTPLSAELAHVAIGTGCDEHATTRVWDAFLTTLEDMRDVGPAEDELETAKRRAERGFRDDQDALRKHLDKAAHEELIGADVLSLEEEIAGLRAVSAPAMRDAVAAALPTLLTLIPEGCKPPRDDLTPLDRRPREVTAPRFKVKAIRQGDELRIGDEGVMWQNGGPPVVIPADEVVAVIEESDGALSVVGADGGYVQVDPATMRDPAAVTEAIKRLSPGPVIPSDDAAPGAVKRLAEEKLSRRWTVSEELELLPDVLEPGEHALTLAEAARGMRSGLLVLTNRRLLFLSAGLRKQELLRFARGDIRTIKRHRKLLGSELHVELADDTLEFSDVRPSERLDEIVTAFAARSD